MRLQRKETDGPSWELQRREEAARSARRVRRRVAVHAVIVVAVDAAVAVVRTVLKRVVAAMRGRREVEQSTKLSVWPSRQLWRVIPSSSYHWTRDWAISQTGRFRGLVGGDMS